MKIEITEKHFDSLLRLYLDGIENLDAEEAKQLSEIIEHIIDPNDLLHNTGELQEPTFTQSNQHNRGNVYLLDEWRAASD